MKIGQGVLTLVVGASLALASSAQASTASHTLTKAQKTARLHRSAATGTDRPYPTVPSYPGIYKTIPSYASGLPGYR